MTQHSPSYLQANRLPLKRLIADLNRHFDSVSVLATDSQGLMFNVRSRSMDLRETMSERGFVFRAFKSGRVAEISLNDLNLDSDQSLQDLIENFNEQFEQQAAFKPFDTQAFTEESLCLDSVQSVQIPFDALTTQAKLDRLKSILDNVQAKDARIVNAIVAFTQVNVQKLYLSSQKDLYQSYPWSQGYIVLVGQTDQGVKTNYEAVSGLKGLELFDELEAKIEVSIEHLDDCFKAKPIVPGEYDIVCTPDITGLIAHEAFGHGVEMDMFVKNRAQAPQFIEKAVASSLLSMHDGALGPKQVSSYAFDDEGTLAHDTMVIENGILKQGICDALSASRLKTQPTGNGKRESFERKAYTRMTSTYFMPGTSKLDDMIASIKHGYLLDGMESGMEDPKNWGIQCVLSRAYEIVDGQLTGQVFGPIILTGYVIDLLKSISMISDDFELAGSGFCGKGHKEWVKTANGGAYIKAKARLG